MSKEKELKFEDAIEELEGIVQSLETGELTIDNAIVEFKKGISLYKRCNEKIKETEGKIKLIIEGEQGDIDEIDFTNAD